MKKTIVIACMIALSAGTALALPFYGDGAYGDFIGDLSYNNGVLSIYLQNTSPSANGGYLTAFAFSVPTSVTGATLNENDPGATWNLLTGPISTAPYDAQDLGSSISTSWLGSSGGVSPTIGLAVGESATFDFTLAGSNLGSLTAASFFGAEDPFFVARFRGFLNGQSDKVPGDPGNPVPEPATLLLLGFGLMGISGYARKKLN